MRQRAVGTGAHLGGEGLCVVARAGSLRMHLRVGGHFDTEMAAGFIADKRDKLSSVAEVAALVARGQIATQCDQTAHAHGAQLLQVRAN